MSSEFLIARGDTAELFELIKASLDEVTGLITMTIIVAWRSSIRARGNNRFGRVGLNLLHQGITVIAFIGGVPSLSRGDDGLGIGRHGQQGIGLTHVGLFGACQGESDRVTQRINDAVNLGSETARRAAQSLRAVFFLAPAACWWARTAVLSIITSSSSRS